MIKEHLFARNSLPSSSSLSTCLSSSSLSEYSLSREIRLGLRSISDMWWKCVFLSKTFSFWTVQNVVWQMYACFRNAYDKCSFVCSWRNRDLKTRKFSPKKKKTLTLLRMQDGIGNMQWLTIGGWICWGNTVHTALGTRFQEMTPS